MLNIYLDERLLHERQRDLERALARQHQRSEARAGQRQSTTRRFTLLSRVLVGFGTRLIGWGQHVQQPRIPASK